MTTVDHDRERLRDLSTRVVRLHKILLDRERRAYEERHGSVPASTLFQLVLHDAQFAWLRALSAMIARIDALVDAQEQVAEADARRVFSDAYRLLKSGGGGEFQDKYHAALQDSPDVVMAHADVSRVLPASKEPAS
jgi:hypothetical protein